MVEIIDELVNLPLQICYLLIYPFFAVVDTVLYTLDQMYVPMALVMNAILNLGNAFISIAKIVLLNFLPIAVAGLLCLLVLLAIFLRIWKFIGGISILGCKLGGQ
jgi:hypothetical protein